MCLEKVEEEIWRVKGRDRMPGSCFRALLDKVKRALILRW